MANHSGGLRKFSEGQLSRPPQKSKSIAGQRPHHWKSYKNSSPPQHFLHESLCQAGAKHIVRRTKSPSTAPNSPRHPSPHPKATNPLSVTFGNGRNIHHRLIHGQRTFLPVRHSAALVLPECVLTLGLSPVVAKIP